MQNHRLVQVDSCVTLCKFGCNVSISPLFERLLHKNHLARVRRTSRFGLKYKHGWKCREASLKNTRSVTRNTAANVSTSPSNYSVVSRLQILKPRFKLHPICSLVVCRSLRTKSSSTLTNVKKTKNKDTSSSSWWHPSLYVLHRPGCLQSPPPVRGRWLSVRRWISNAVKATAEPGVWWCFCCVHWCMS